MRARILALVLCGFTSAALAVDKPELDERIRKLAFRFDEMQQSGKAVPAAELRQAKGIILLERTKAGFLFAYQGGGGIALMRDAKGKWSPAAFLSANEASLGFVVGGEQAFFVILLMNTNATRLLTETTFDLGGEAGGTAANVSGGAQGSLANTERPVVVYDDKKGLYGGAALKAGAISPDEDDNGAYYGKYTTMRDILFQKKFKPSQPMTDLAAKIDQYAKPAKK